MASSESDADEFYDAEEATPVRRGKQSGISFGHQDSIGSLCSAGSDTSESQIPIQDLEEEEKKLLEQKRLADERRQREDEELRKRLEDLEAKKKKELEARKKKEAERLEVMRKAEEQEERRRKLQEMRDSMMEEGTPAQGGPPKPPRTYMHEEDMAMEDGAEGGADTDVEEESILDISGEKNALSQHSGDNIHEKSMDHNVLGDVEDNEEGDINLNTPTVEEEKVASKHLTALMSSTEDQQCSSDSKDDVFVDSDDTVTKDNTKLQSQQPDIVQSTKPRPSDLPPPRPVAPPRRKRTNKGPPPPRPPPPSSASQVGGAEAAGRERGMSQSTQSEVKGLPLELPTPTSTILSLTKDLEQSLDLHSATSGTRLVTAAEEVSNKADLTEEERKRQSKTKDEAKPVQKEEMVGPVKPKSAEDGTLVGDEQKEEVKRKEEDSKEDGSVPESTQFTFRGTMRPRSNSGSRYLTDVEILDMVTVLNLDTGETVPLSLAEDKLPKCVNPLSLHIMRRTKEYSSDSSLHKNAASDEDDGKPSPGTKTIRSVKPRFKTRKIKKFLGKTVNKLKSVADEVLHGEGAGADNSSEEEDESLEGRRMIKIKASSHHKGPYDFDLLVPVQDLLGEHSGAIWTMKWSQCGRLLATGGQDNLLRVWVLREHYSYFDDMRRKYSKSKVSPAPSQDSLNSQSSENSSHSEVASSIDDAEVDEHAPFMSKPFCIYKGHTADLLDLSWSKNYFILSSSMDKTVRLWHISRKECLCCFQHIDFVTAIAFHPRDDRYFLSGSLDGKLRLWNIPDKKVALWNEVLGTTKLITAANFCLNGRFAVVGTYDGRCIFYSTEHLKYYTQIHVRSTRGRNARGRKVTGIEPVPGEDKILVTSNDSRIRLYDLRDLTLTSKYKGCANNSSQIKASFSANGKYIICGSEDHFVYIWRTQHEFYKYTSARRDRNDFWEGIKAHSAVVTVAMFAPNPGLIIKPQFQFMDSENKEVPEVRGEVLVSADFSGAIKVFINKFKPGSG